MKLKKPKRAPFLETCAASDMAFLLIIYFMVIAGFNLSIGFLVNLPLKDSTRLILRDDLIRFELNENSDIIYDGDIIQISDAKKLISGAIAVNPNIAVILNINRAVMWQNVVSFVELAQDLKISAFSFSMQREQLQ